MGKHYLLNLYGCSFENLNSLDFIIESITRAANLSQATILNTSFHKFEPFGVTAILLLAESHISIHTWPDEGSAALDIYTCSKIDPKIGCDYLIEKFQPVTHNLTFINR
jgi:S-adenosylmethionine decarboxylase